MKFSTALLVSTFTAAQADDIGAAAQRAKIRGGVQPYLNIAGYMPGTQVADHCAIDLDQDAIETQLASRDLNGALEPNFDDACNIYNGGGHSKSYALLFFGEGGTQRSISKGEILVVGDNDDDSVCGKAAADYEANAACIKLYYITTNQGVQCQVGALVEHVDMSGCFPMGGVLKTKDGTQDVVGSYSYSLENDNRNDRTIAGFSTQAGEKMSDMVDFEHFKAYYGMADYANHWVTSAFDGVSTQFVNGNADFTQYNNVGKVQAIKKGTAYLNVFMYVIREFEDALDDCGNRDNDSGVHAWDEGVAFYTGSLEGQNPGGDAAGKLLYRLADKRCKNFKTCGSNGDGTDGTSKINMELFDLFDRGKDELSGGNCDAARIIVPDITAKMYVPMVQGTLRYAYKVAHQGGTEKEKAEGAIFAAAVLPKVHSICPDTAAMIYTQMKVGAESTSFVVVKESFESVYARMGITCADVGGLWSEGEGDYYDGAEPCHDPDGKMETRVWSEKFEAVSKVLRGANTVVME